MLSSQAGNPKKNCAQKETWICRTNLLDRSRVLNKFTLYFNAELRQQAIQGMGIFHPCLVICGGVYVS